MIRGGLRSLRVALACAITLLAPGFALAGDWIAGGKTGCKVWNPHPSSGETVAWNGPCKDGFADGKGVLDWLRAGSRFERDEGIWRAGRQTGEGTQSWPLGEYKGQFSESLPEGRGTLVLGERRYEGTFLRGKPDGSGVLTEPSGKISGTWHEGCFNDGTRRAAIGVTLQSCP